MTIRSGSNVYSVTLNSENARQFHRGKVLDKLGRMGGNGVRGDCDIGHDNKRQIEIISGGCPRAVLK